MDNAISLRALTRSDIEKTLMWNNQSDIVDMYAGHPFPVNAEMESLWYDRILTSNIPTTVFGIQCCENGELIGLTLLKDINFIHSNAEIAIYIGDPTYRGKGLSKLALDLTISFAFNELGLHRLWLKVRSDNVAALHLYSSYGFLNEGILKDSVYKHGSYHDLFVMALINDKSGLPNN